jgi:hypothetical protein
MRKSVMQTASRFYNELRPYQKNKKSWAVCLRRAWDRVKNEMAETASDLAPLHVLRIAQINLYSFRQFCTFHGIKNFKLSDLNRADVQILISYSTRLVEWAKDYNKKFKGGFIGFENGEAFIFGNDDFKTWENENREKVARDVDRFYNSKKQLAEVSKKTTFDISGFAKALKDFIQINKDRK